MQQQKLWRNSSKRICKIYCRRGNGQSDFKKYNERGMAGDGCASFLMTGKSHKQQFFWGVPAPECKRRVKEAMDRVALQAERRIAIFDGHVREVME